MLTDETRQLGQFIPLHYHYNMLQDNNRMENFLKAISQLVFPGDKVVELGGGTGVLSFYAAQKASKVYTVELNLDLAEVARGLLKMNPNGERVEVIHGNAMEFVPPEPVDVVICEMLHVGLLREKQLEVITAFKKNYIEKHGNKLPIFIPGATFQAVQAVEHDFVFGGYYAPVTLFQDPYSIHERTKDLSEPVIYHQVLYNQSYSNEMAFSGNLQATANGKINALRFITKNILAVNPDGTGTTDWHNQYMILPLESPLEVKSGETVKISFSYNGGDPLTAVKPQILKG